MRDLGASRSQQRTLARAVTRGALLRVRTGVYAVPDAHPELIHAARIGGRLSGVSALVHHELWTPPGSLPARLSVEVHVSITARRGLVSGLTPRISWLRQRPHPQYGVAPLPVVLARAANDLPLPFAVAVLDSALRLTPMTPVDLAFLASSWCLAARATAALADERSESGTESVLPVLLREAGIHSMAQAPLPLGRNERADLLVGDRLLIECDSEAHHAEPANRRADLRRDESLLALGYLVLRVDYQQVFEDPGAVVAAISAIVARGDHLSLRSTVWP